MTDHREAFAAAQKQLEKLPGAGRLTKSIAGLLRAGVDRDQARAWAARMDKLFGLSLTADELNHCMARALAAMGSSAPEAAAPEPAAVTAEPAPIDTEVPDPEPLVDPELPAAFSDAKQLLAIAVDASATKRRLAELEKAQRELGKASERLAGHRSVFERRAQRIRAALAEQQAELRKGWEALRQREYQLAEAEKRHDAELKDAERWRAFSYHQRYEELPGGMIRVRDNWP
jgi:hypothetical protein